VYRTGIGAPSANAVLVTVNFVGTDGRITGIGDGGGPVSTGVGVCSGVGVLPLQPASASAPAVASAASGSRRKVGNVTGAL